MEWGVRGCKGPAWDNKICVGRKPPVMSLSREAWADGAMPAHISSSSI